MFAMESCPAKAADILFVTDGSPVPVNDIRDLLTHAGHTVTDFDFTTYGYDLGDNNGVDYANGFDLIVHSRNVNGVYDNLAPHGAVWNALTTQAITLDVFRTGGEFGANSWSWGSPVNSLLPTSTAAGDTYTVTVPSDPILTGITLTGGATPALLNGTGRYWDLGVGASPLAGVTVIAHQPGNPLNVAIAYAAPGALQPGGAAQYFMVGGNFGETDENIFTAEGETVFLNAVASLTGGIAPDGPFQVTITRNPDTPGSLDFTWASQPDKLYDLLTSTDLADPISEWPVYNDGETLHEAIPTAGETTTRTAVPSTDPRRFFAVREYDTPP